MAVLLIRDASDAQAIVTTNSNTGNSQPNAPSQRHHTTKHLVHLPDELVDVVLPVTQVTALDEVLELTRPEATGGVGKLEGPQEVARLLEVRADGVDLMDQVLHADDAVLAEVLLDDGVVGERDAVLLARLGVSTLVDELAHALQVRVAVGDERLDDLQHFARRLGQTDEHAIVDLQQAEKLESLALLRVDLVDTLDADDEGELGFGGDVVAAFLLRNTREADLLTLSVTVFLDVRLGALEDLLALRLALLDSCEHTVQNKTNDSSARESCTFSPERWLTNDNIAEASRG